MIGGCELRWGLTLGILLLCAAGRGAAQTPGTDSQSLARLIDTEVQKRLDAEKMPASPPVDDAEFLRRVYLDIVGVIPPPDRAAAFLDSQDPEKRARLIDALLETPTYAQYMADLWKALLIPNTAASLRRRHEPMSLWLEEAFARNKPWNQFVTEVLTAAGMQDENGAVTFYVTHESLDQLTDRVSRLFLGVQLQCAQCHNHPFADWKQTDYWGLAAFFSKVRPQYAREKNGKERYGSAETGTRKPLTSPPSALSVPPRFLGGEQPRLDPATSYLTALAGWMTSSKNPYFARAMVNRTWQQFFGRGLVQPVDDLREENDASHPELLDQLARRFVAGNYDVKNLIRGICNSRTYQRTSRPLAGNQEDTTLLSHMAIKVMNPYQLYQSLEQVLTLGAPTGIPPRPHTADDLRRWLARRNGFVDYFNGNEDAEPTEYQAGIPQALRLMNSNETDRVTRVIGGLVKKPTEPAPLLERLFLATLSRRPTTAEMEKTLADVQQQSDRNRAYADILWALLNCTEFMANH